MKSITEGLNNLWVSSAAKCVPTGHKGIILVWHYEPFFVLSAIVSEAVLVGLKPKSDLHGQPCELT